MTALLRRVAGVASLTLALAGCGGGRDEVSPQEIVADPPGYFGEDVVVESTVSHPIDHRVWEMAGGRLFVIYDRGLDSGLAVGEPLRVVGTVQPLERAMIEGALGVNIEDHFFDEPSLDDDVALVADSVTRLERER